MTPRLLSALLVLLGISPVPSVATDWVSAQHRCGLTLPEGESWLGGLRQKIPVGQIIYHSNAVQTNEGIMVTVVPELPARELAGPELIKRITETLASQGFTPEDPAQITWLNLPSFELTARRRDSIFGLVLGVTRATLRGTDLFIVTAYGKGEEDRARDKHFTRVLDTFRFVDPGSIQQGGGPGPSQWSYLAGAIACAAAAVLLVVLFSVMIFITREIADGA